MKQIKGLIALLLALVIALCLAACGGKADDKATETEKPATETAAPAETKKPASEPKTFSADMERVQTLLDYAERLEAAGNDAAAARVYAMLGDAMEADARLAAEKALEDDPILRLQRGLIDAERQMEAWKEVVGK